MIAKKFTIKAKNGDKWTSISKYQTGHCFALIDLEDDDRLPVIEKENSEFFVDGNHNVPFIQFFYTKEEFGLMEALLDFHQNDFQEFIYICLHDCRLDSWYDVNLTYPSEYQLNNAKDDFEIESMDFNINDELNLYEASNKCTAKNQDMINVLFKIKEKYNKEYNNPL